MTNAGDGSLELQGGASVDRAAALSARVLELHEDRCNCAQSLACAFSDIAQVDADTLFVLMEGFGAGMGGHAETCGAVTAGVAVIGALASDGRASRTTKEATYEMASEFVEAFRGECGSTTCHVLKEMSPVPTPHRCDAYMTCAVRHLLRVLEERGLTDAGR